MKSLVRFLPSRRWLLLPPLAIGIAVVVLMASSKKELARVELQESANPLEVLRLRKVMVAAEVVGYGTAVPRRTWSAVAEVGGRIIETHPNLRPGVAVAEGDLLVLIDPSDYQLRLQQRAAELAQVQAQLEQTHLAERAEKESLVIQQDLLKVRQDDVDRLQELSQRSAASRTDIDFAKATLLQQLQAVQTLNSALATYPQQFASAEAAVMLAKARLSEAERDVERTRIVAPFDGLLAGVRLERDQYVAANQQLFDVVDALCVEIDAQFSIAQLTQVLSHSSDVHGSSASSSLNGVGGPPVDCEIVNPLEFFPTDRLSAEVIVRSGDVTLTYEGQVVRMTDSLDPTTRTAGIVVRVCNVPERTARTALALRAGAYCEVVLRSNQPLAVHLVPRTSVDGDCVYVVDKNNRLRRRSINVAFPLRDDLAVASGLLDDERVVINPPAVAFEGELIAPQINDDSDVTPPAVEMRPAESGAEIGK